MPLNFLMKNCVSRFHWAALTQMPQHLLLLQQQPVPSDVTTGTVNMKVEAT